MFSEIFDLQSIFSVINSVNFPKLLNLEARFPEKFHSRQIVFPRLWRSRQRLFDMFPEARQLLFPRVSGIGTSNLREIDISNYFSRKILRDFFGFPEKIRVILRDFFGTCRDFSETTGLVPKRYSDRSEWFSDKFQQILRETNQCNLLDTLDFILDIVEFCPTMSSNVQGFLSNLVQECPNLSSNVQDCPKMSNLV